MTATPFEGPGWRVLLPETISTRLKPRPAPDTDIATMAIARGSIGDGDPVTIIITVRPRGALEPETFASGLLLDAEPPVTRRQVAVRGGVAGIRLSGRMYVEEGVVLDGYERIDLLVVPGGGTLTTLAVRVPAEAAVDEAVEAIIASFEVIPA